MIELIKGFSDEYKYLEKNFKLSLPNANIISIKRIQVNYLFIYFNIYSCRTMDCLGCFPSPNTLCFNTNQNQQQDSRRSKRGTFTMETITLRDAMKS